MMNLWGVQGLARFCRGAGRPLRYTSTMGGYMSQALIDFKLPSGRFMVQFVIATALVLAAYKYVVPASIKTKVNSLLL